MVFIFTVTNTQNPPSEILDSEGSADFSDVYRYAFFGKWKDMYKTGFIEVAMQVLT